MPRVESQDGGSSWSTSSYGEPADTTPVELSGLGEHLTLCRLGGRLSALHCAAQGLRGFVAAHLVTSLMVAAAVLVTVAWLVM